MQGRRPNPRGIAAQLETERLVIRAPRPGDGALVYASVVESLEALREFPSSLPWAVAPPLLSASEEFCVEGAANYRALTDMPMLLFLKDGGEHVGNSGLHRFDGSVGEGEIGYWCRTRFRGRGLVTEAVRAIAAFGLGELGLARVVALPDERNVASCRVCERAGLRLEATVRKAQGTPDERNVRIYCLGAGKDPGAI
ncbi:MAG: GNAT family N-acetyltransferase [Usitatibacter sp.]